MKNGTCHAEGSEASAFLHLQKQILRRFAPQDDIIAGFSPIY
jgi:hypothetical protein